VKIVILGWGSLLWEQHDEFDNQHDGWQLDGPTLRLEFSRVSHTRKDALTLVIDENNGQACRVAYAISRREKPEDAIGDLRCREETLVGYIGFYFANGSRLAQSHNIGSLENIRSWAKEKRIDVVIWTDLVSNFQDKSRHGEQFSISSALSHIQLLDAEGKAKAAEYVWRAPEFIDTPLRKALQSKPWFKMPKKQLQPTQYPQAIQFSEQLTNSDLWIAKAGELLKAADILKLEVVKYWSELRGEDSASTTQIVQGAYFLLIAYAIENYFKALLIYSNQKSLKNRLLFNLPSWLNQHDLVKLAHDVQLTLDTAEEELLFRLSQNSTWKARYPVPTVSDALVAIKEFSNGKASLIAYFGPQDVDRIGNFIDRLHKYVLKKLERES
jgi:hypothetical protein